MYNDDLVDVMIVLTGENKTKTTQFGFWFSNNCVCPTQGISVVFVDVGRSTLEMVLLLLWLTLRWWWCEQSVYKFSIQLFNFDQKRIYRYNVWCTAHLVHFVYKLFDGNDWQLGGLYSIVPYIFNERWLFWLISRHLLALDLIWPLQMQHQLMKMRREELRYLNGNVTFQYSTRYLMYIDSLYFRNRAHITSFGTSHHRSPGKKIRFTMLSMGKCWSFKLARIIDWPIPCIHHRFDLLNEYRHLSYVRRRIPRM